MLMTNERNQDIVKDIRIESEMKSLAIDSIAKLRNFLANPSEDKSTVLALKAAQVSLSNYTRHEATQGAREATTFMMARELASNAEELEHYMKVAMPSSPVTKAIPTKAIPQKA